MTTAALTSLHAHDAMQARTAAIRERLTAARTEAVTGRAADPARAAGGDVGRVQRLEASLDYATTRADALAFASTRLMAGQDAMTAIRETAQGVGLGLTVALGSPAPQALEAAWAEASSALPATLSRLNASFGGRPLFGGNTGEAPLAPLADLVAELDALAAGAPDADAAIAAVDAWFADGGGFLASIHRGGDGPGAEVELAPGERLRLGPPASDPAFRDVLRGLALAHVALAQPDDAAQRTVLEAAATALQGGSDRLVALQAETGVAEERVERARLGHEARIVTLQSGLDALIGRDQAEAISEMRMLETQLEAAYLTTARLANLSLVSFLR